MAQLNSEKNKRVNRIQKIWSLLISGKERGSSPLSPSGSDPAARPQESGLEGSQDSPRALGSFSRIQDYMLDLPDEPTRPINGSLNTSADLAEMAIWSREGRDVGSYLSRDCFMESSGRSGSWSVGTATMGGETVNKDVIAIARNLASRRNGKELILGGNRLKRAASDAGAFFGDSFLELAIETEGISRKDYGISNSLYLPALSVFVDESVDGRLNGYWQRASMSPAPGDIYIHPLKMLHFSYERGRRYGHPLLLQSVPTWRKLKRVAPALEKAIQQTSVAPWLHLMPEGKNEKYRQAYARAHQEQEAQGILSNLYLLDGHDVKRAAGGNQDLGTLVDHWLNLRAMLVPAGFPSYLFPRLGSGSGANNKELANQPAGVYARLISDVRAMLGEQIKWALDLEILLSRGYDFLMENVNYEIVWPEWETVPVGDSSHKPTGNSEQQSTSRKVEPASKPVEEKDDPTEANSKGDISHKNESLIYSA